MCLCSCALISLPCAPSEIARTREEPSRPSTVTFHRHRSLRYSDSLFNAGQLVQEEPAGTTSTFETLLLGPAFTAADIYELIPSSKLLPVSIFPPRMDLACDLNGKFGFSSRQTVNTLLLAPLPGVSRHLRDPGTVCRCFRPKYWSTAR